jgi:uncharacterized OB-fold protein
MTGISVTLCGTCGWRGFPARVWCPRCGAFAVQAATVTRGRVSAVTQLVHSVGRTLENDVLVAEIKLEEGGRVIARLTAPGLAEIVLIDDDGVPVASPQAP